MIDVETVRSGFWVHRGAAPRMGAAHRHEDIEVNVVLRGALDYVFDGSAVRIDEGRMAVFWAGAPHRLLPSEGDGGDIAWLHIPLPVFTSWAGSAEPLARLLRRELAITEIADAHPDLEWAFTRWQEELHAGDELPAIWEIQALLHRALHGASLVPATPTATGDTALRAVAAMAQLASTRFREPIGATDVASAACYHPRHAMTVFRRVMGSSIGDYIAECRVAEAQRLLVLTPDPLQDVAHAAGFSSQATFYATFARIVGTSPGAYRRGAGGVRREPPG